MQSLAHDINYALRQIRRAPAFAFFVIATLAVGIGANVTIFSAVNALLLRPLPYADADRLVQLWGRYEGGGDRWSVSLPNALDWREQNRSFVDLAYFTGATFALAGDGAPERLRGVRSSANLFAVLGREPALGRTFTPAEASRDGELVVVLGHSLWQRRYAAHPGVLGQTVLLGGRSYTIIGVMPPDFAFPAPETALWVPLQETPGTWSREQGGLQTVARLRPGITLEQARFDMDAVSARLAAEHPVVNAELSAAVRPLRESLFGGIANVALMLTTVLAAVGLVLLIACVNVANLLLARATAREREIAVRAAMGAPRRRLIRHFLTESVVLALLGGVAGVLLSLWGTAAIAAIVPAEAPFAREFPLDLRVLGFALGITLLTGVLFGTAPALHASRTDLTMMFGTRATASAIRHNRRRDVLVVAQVALAAVLLVGAGLMVRSMLELLSRPPGFDERNALTLRIALDASYTDRDRVVAFQNDVLQRIAGLPGVVATGAVDFLPLGGTNNFSDIVLEDDARHNVGAVHVTPGYFEAMGIPILRGRVFDGRDVRDAPGAAVVSRTLADALWPGEDPIGKRLVLGYERQPEPYWRTIVGVTGDVRHGGLHAEPRAEVYAPYAQLPFGPPFMTVVVRATGDPLALVEPVRDAVWSVDRNQPVFDVRTMQRVVRESSTMLIARVLASALTIFGGLALALAAIGLYGVVSYNVAQRTYEFGVRAALGAERGDLLRLVLRRGLMLVVLGLLLGYAVALAAGRLIAGLLFGVRPLDPITYAAVAAMLAAVATVAMVVPALRAARISPTLALRE